MLKLNNLQHWMLTTPLGRKVLAAEEVFYHNNVRNIFGYYSLQTCLPQINFLSNNKISSKYVIGNSIKCDVSILPFATDSIDLIICPHILELIPNYHHFLQECYRVLMPKGKIIISNFNPSSLFGLFGKNNDFLKQINYIHLNDLKQQLATLNFNICGGKYFCYFPPLQNEKYLAHFKFLDKIGDRWFPTFANCYAIIASKEIITPTLIKPQFKTNPSPSLVPDFGLTSMKEYNND